MKLLFSNPDKIFSIIEGKGGSLDELRKVKLGRILARERYLELKDKDILDAAEFMFWFSYFVEREIRESIFEVEVIQGKVSEDIDKMVDTMTFGEKIGFIEKNYIEDENQDPFVKHLREIKTLRNHMAHGRLEKLKFGGYKLSDPRGQIKLISHFTNVCVRRKSFM